MNSSASRLSKVSIEGKRKDVFKSNDDFFSKNWQGVSQKSTQNQLKIVATAHQLLTYLNSYFNESLLCLTINAGRTSQTRLPIGSTFAIACNILWVKTTVIAYMTFFSASLLFCLFGVQREVHFICKLHDAGLT